MDDLSDTLAALEEFGYIKNRHTPGSHGGARPVVRDNDKRVGSRASSRLTPEQRTLRARIAAHTLHAKGGTNTTAAKAAFMAKFEREVDPDGILAPEDRRKRADHARRAHMLALSLKASRVRSARVASRGGSKGCDPAASA